MKECICNVHRDNIWLYRKALIPGIVIRNDPKATRKFSSEDLKAKGYLGVYRIRDAADPDLFLSRLSRVMAGLPPEDGMPYPLALFSRVKDPGFNGYRVDIQYSQVDAECASVEASDLDEGVRKAEELFRIEMITEDLSVGNDLWRGQHAFRFRQLEEVEMPGS